MTNRVISRAQTQFQQDLKRLTRSFGEQAIEWCHPPDSWPVGQQQAYYHAKQAHRPLGHINPFRFNLPNQQAVAQ